MPTLCSLAPADADALLRLYTEPAVREFLGGPLSAVEARRRVDALLGGTEPHLSWVVRSNVGGRCVFLGMVFLGPHHDGQDVEVSCLLLPEHQGCGYASQAVADVMAYASSILGLARVVAETQSQNARSIRLLKRVGMVFERSVVRFGAEQSIYASRTVSGQIIPDLDL